MRKTGLWLETSFKDKRLEVRKNWKSGFIKLFKYDEIVVDSHFSFNKTAVWITWIETKPHFRKCGYGRLVIDFYKSLCKIMRVPLFLSSLDDVIEFYEKLGFRRVIEIKEKFEVIENKKYSWDEYDYVWLPSEIKYKKKIRVHGF